MKSEIWRPRIKIAALGTILLSLVAFVTGYSSSSYLFWYLCWLIGTFLAVLGVSHAIYAEWETVPILAVRLIDYVYVGCGCGAAFFAVQEHQYERETILRAQELARVNFELVRINSYAQSLLVSPNRENLEKTISEDMEKFCTNKSQVEILKGRPNRRRDLNSDLTAAERRELTGKFCNWAKSLRGFVAEEPSISGLTKELAAAPPFFATAACEMFVQSQTGQSSREWLEHPLGGHKQWPEHPLKGPEPFKLQMYNLQFCERDKAGENLVNVLETMLDNKRKAEQIALEKKRKEQQIERLMLEKKRLEGLLQPQPDSTRYGIFKIIYWPFLLAIALAMRLTKVTADVTAWAVVPRVGPA